MKALLVIDMQKALFAAGKRYDTDGVISRINFLIEKARETKIPLIFIRHNNDEDELSIDSEGWQILEELDFRANDITIEKTCCDSFCNTDLAEKLNDAHVDELILTGCCTDFCIDSTIRQATSMNFKVIVASNAHTTADKPYLEAKTIIKHHNFVWSELYSSHPIEVLPTEMILNEI